MHYYNGINNKEQGFTLIELLIVLSLGSLVLALGVMPAYRAWWQSHRLKLSAYRLVDSLHFARSVAIQNARHLSVCQSKNQAFSQKGWEDGWKISVSEDQQSSEVLHEFRKLPSEQRLSWHGARHVPCVQFQPEGTSLGYNGRFVLCSKGSKIAWFVFVSQTGRIRLESSRDLSYCEVLNV